MFNVYCHLTAIIIKYGKWAIINILNGVWTLQNQTRLNQLEIDGHHRKVNLKNLIGLYNSNSVFELKRDKKKAPQQNKIINASYEHSSFVYFKNNCSNTY